MVIAGCGGSDDKDESASSSAGATAAASADAKNETCTDPDTVRAQVWEGDIVNIALWVAEEKGFFKEQCLKSEGVPIMGGAAGFTALANGTIDFSSNGPDGVLRSRQQGLPLQIVGNIYAGHWNAVVGRKGLNVPQGYPEVMKGLKGKKLGVTARGATTESFFRSAFVGAGMPADSGTPIGLGGATTMIAALKKGSTDATMMAGMGPELAEALGAGDIILDYREKGTGPESTNKLWGTTFAWVVHEKTIKKDPELVARFVKASNAAIAWAKDPANREELLGILKPKVAMPPGVPNADETFERGVDSNVKLIDTGIPEESIAAWNDYLINEAKELKAAIPFDDVVYGETAVSEE